MRARNYTRLSFASNEDFLPESNISWISEVIWSSNTEGGRNWYVCQTGESYFFYSHNLLKTDRTRKVNGMFKVVSSRDAASQSAFDCEKSCEWRKFNSFEQSDSDDASEENGLRKNLSTVVDDHMSAAPGTEYSHKHKCATCTAWRRLCNLFWSTLE
jgi:hypothetical protein